MLGVGSGLGLGLGVGVGLGSGLGFGPLHLLQVERGQEGAQLDGGDRLGHARRLDQWRAEERGQARARLG